MTTTHDDGEAGITDVGPPDRSMRDAEPIIITGPDGSNTVTGDQVNAFSLWDMVLTFVYPVVVIAVVCAVAWALAHHGVTT